MIQRILRLLSPKKNEWTKAFDISTRIEKALIARFGEDAVKIVKGLNFFVHPVTGSVGDKSELIGHVIYDVFVTGPGKTEKIFFVATENHSVLFTCEPVKVDEKLLERVLSALAPPDEAE